jgi:hypothetical protein
VPPQFAKTALTVGHVVQRRGDDCPPAALLAILVGPPAGGSINFFLRSECGPESGGDDGLIESAAESPAHFRIDGLRRRVRPNQCADGVEYDGPYAG